MKKLYSRKTETAVPLGLSVREVPQSVSVITQQRLQDQQLSTLVEVAENVTGVLTVMKPTEVESIHVVL